MLSFSYIKKNSPIEIAETDNNKILYYYDDIDSSLVCDKNDIDPVEILGKDFFIKNGYHKYISSKDLELLRKAIINNKPPKNDNLIEIYDSAINALEDKACKEIRINSLSTFKPLFNDTKEREVYFIAGCSGSGKSYFTANLAVDYHEKHPKNKIFIFSKLTKDPAFDDKKYIKRIMIDDDLVDNPIDLNEIKDTLIIIDDCDTLLKKYKVVIEQLQNDILDLGRKFNISLILSQHKLMDYKNTRSIIMETHKVVFFIGFGGIYHINRFLKTYAGLSKSQAKRIINLRSRWVMYNMHRPNYILSEHECYLLSPELEK